MSHERKPTVAPIDALLQSLSQLPGLPLAVDNTPEPHTLLDQVLREHPQLTRAEASEVLIAFGSSASEDVRVIHAWRRSGLRAYQRVPPPSDQETPS